MTFQVVKQLNDNVKDKERNQIFQNKTQKRFENKNGICICICLNDAHNIKLNERSDDAVSNI